jgi:hypothetical protein
MGDQKGPVSYGFEFNKVRPSVSRPQLWRQPKTGALRLAVLCESPCSLLIPLRRRRSIDSRGRGRPHGLRRPRHPRPGACSPVWRAGGSLTRSLAPGEAGSERGPHRAPAGGARDVTSVGGGRCCHQRAAQGDPVGARPRQREGGWWPPRAA